MFRHRSTVLAPILLTPILLAVLFCAHPALAEDAVASDEAPFDEKAYVQEVAEWHAKRVENLRKPDGWFSLVGLEWLEDGPNPIGSDADSKVKMPAKAPASLGVLHLDAGRVQFTTAPGVQVTSKGKPVKWLKLQSDADGEPTELEVGSFLFYVIERGGQFGVRIKDRESPALAAFEDIETFPVDPAWRIVGRLEPHNPPRTIAVPNVLGMVEESPSPGSVVFEVDGQRHSLDALPAGDDGLFMVFADETNGETTYGGGRFLYAEIVKGKVVLDFNKAYNPPCAFTAFATCPLPPKRNRLGLRVEAGEKNYGAPH